MKHKARSSAPARAVSAALLLTASWGTAAADAKPIAKENVATAVTTWLKQVIGMPRSDALVETIEAYVYAGRTAAYVAHLRGGGFCLCGADDLLLPVYYYSPAGTFDPRNPELLYFLREIGVRLQTVQAGLASNDPRIRPYLDELQQREADWWNLIGGAKPPRYVRGDRTDPTLMVLPLTCHWGQGVPYNHACPILTPGSDEYTYAGCVAIALAQTMYYWRWPFQGEGIEWTTYAKWHRTDWDEEPLATNPGIPAGAPWTGRLEWTSAGGGRLRMNGWWDESVYLGASDISISTAYRTALSNLFGRLTYAPTDYGFDMGLVPEWDEIHDEHFPPYGPEDCRVADLCYAAGVAVQMDYGLLGSGAYTSHDPEALEQNFGYDTDATYGARDITTMTTEIQWLRPLILRGTDPNNGAHSWVVCGYDKSTDPSRSFWMNLGWSGSSDGWYTCDTIFFPDDQAHVTRIAPAGVVKFVGATNAGDGSPDDPYQNITEAVAEASDYATLIFKAGSLNTFSGTSLTISRPLTLKGHDVTIQPQ